MHVVDKDLGKNQKQRQNLQTARAASEEPEDMELTIPAIPMAPLNNSPDLFDAAAQKKWSGLNTAPSVFEKNALFNTGGTAQDEGRE